ncbi:related to transaminase type I [Fusarium fujikuroi IMI 58289]|uniref:Related to transaminase type I n=1 Tax=Gibberella fujikuroi (strain CBS 195.34 / IMI 58289 / NRRL A-6831) TaxID=1279085 RepID=S0EE16_GIBF5|nr:related to transaminase type I [Fusarium fujikuroi IMI 58289]KLP14679.1 transaminase type I [Fusarium fujikuroi]CCT73181.1 related to transaminase type I [Fusarium fujikuroi IMI 58289]SCO16230.1 related to transaminase type I [Fusarium fujikuroi]
MHDIPEFELDRVARSYGPRAKIALHGSAPHALSLDNLRGLSSTKLSPIETNIPLSYAPSLGSVELRKRVAEIYSTESAPLTEDNVIITPGSIMANYLVLSTTCTKGDHVICQFPNYGPLYLLPKYFGAEVDFWVGREEESWNPDVEELRALIRPTTKAIILTNPCNPTGTVLGQEMLEQIRDLAKKHNIAIFGDEVFRPLFHDNSQIPPSFVSLGYSNTITTGSVSKAYSLPGIRIGWIISPNRDILQRIIAARDYTTLNVSRIDDAIALFALSPDVLPKIVAQILETQGKNIDQYDQFVKRNSDRCRWVRPRGGGTAFIHFSGPNGKSIDEVAFAEKLIQDFGVAVIPASAGFSEEGVADYKGYLRLSLGQRVEAVAEGLRAIQLAIQDF